MEFDPGAVGVGDGQCRLQAEEGLVLHPDVVRALHGDWTRCGGITVDDALVTDHVARGVDRIARRIYGVFGVEEGFEHLVLDDDGLESPLAGRRIGRGDRGDRFADEAHLITGEHRLVGLDQSIGRLPGDVLGSEHDAHPRYRQRRGGVDPEDAGPWVRGPECGAPEGPIGGEIGRELELATDLGHGIGPGHRLAEATGDRRGTRRRSVGRGAGRRAHDPDRAAEWTASTMRP